MRNEIPEQESENALWDEQIFKTLKYLIESLYSTIGILSKNLPDDSELFFEECKKYKNQLKMIRQELEILGRQVQTFRVQTEKAVEFTSGELENLYKALNGLIIGNTIELEDYLEEEIHHWWIGRENWRYLTAIFNEVQRELSSWTQPIL